MEDTPFWCVYFKKNISRRIKSNKDTTVFLEKKNEEKRLFWLRYKIFLSSVGFFLTLINFIFCTSIFIAYFVCFLSLSQLALLFAIASISTQRKGLLTVTSLTQEKASSLFFFSFLFFYILNPWNIFFRFSSSDLSSSVDTIVAIIQAQLISVTELNWEMYVE